VLSRVWLSLTLLVPLTLACTPTNPPPGPDKQPVAPDVQPSPESREGVSRGLLRATFIPQYDVITRSPDGSQQLDFMIRIDGDQPEGELVRPALDLAIVLDRSGSMSGTKIHYAKQAGLDLLSRLSPADRVTLISYDDRVTMHAATLAADHDGIERLRNLLLDIYPGASTALGPALFVALESFDDHQQQSDRLTHVLLLSDGLANVGEQRPDVLAARAALGYQHGTTISSLGMGLDYNEDLMTSIADQGGGRYHFIEAAEHIPTVLADEFAGLTSTIAADLTVEFAAHAPTKLDGVYGYVSETRDELTSIRVGYLGAGQTREIMARIEIPATRLHEQVGDTVELGLITVRFRPMDDANASPDAPLVELQIPAAVTLGGSRDEMVASEHTEVTVRMVEVEAAETLRLATAAVDQGDWTTASQVYERGGAELEDKLQASTSELERQKLLEEQKQLEAALAGLQEAKQSEAARKGYSKRNKAIVYEKGKGSKKKSK
jgi:Ca-activated chloride channel family protein